MNLFIIFLIVAGVMSLLTLAVFALDKKLSGKESNGRIPEIVLLSLTTFFGAPGALIGMYVLRHKTNFATKFHFAVTLWLALALQAAIGVLLFIKRGG